MVSKNKTTRALRAMSLLSTAALCTMLMLPGSAIAEAPPTPPCPFVSAAPPIVSTWCLQMCMEGFQLIGLSQQAAYNQCCSSYVTANLECPVYIFPQISVPISTGPYTSGPYALVVEGVVTAYDATWGDYDEAVVVLQDVGHGILYPQDQCTDAFTLSVAGLAYVETRGLDGGSWVYLETNGQPGLQRGGWTPYGTGALAYPDPCSDGGEPDQLIF